MDLEPRTDTLIMPAGTERVVVLGDPHGDLAGLDAVLAREDRPGTVIVSVGDNIGYADGPTSSEFCRRLAERKIQSVYGNHEAWMDEGGRLFIVGDRGAPRQVSAEAVAWCRSLPFRLRAEWGGLKISVVHSLTCAVQPETWDLPIKSETIQATIVTGSTEDIAWDYVSAANADLLANDEQADVVFVGHSHGPAIYTIPPEASTRVSRLDLEKGEPLTIFVKPGLKYVVDAGSLARPGFHPEPGRFDLGAYAVLNLGRRVIALHAVGKAV